MSMSKERGVWERGGSESGGLEGGWLRDLEIFSVCSLFTEVISITCPPLKIRRSIGAVTL